MLPSPDAEVTRLHVAYRTPDVGESVGAYKVVEMLGRGGLGVVFKVERDGRFYAMKLLRVPELNGRAEREIAVLMHLKNPSVVRYVGSDFWPHPVTGHPYIVMDYVPGETLEAFAFRVNPCARKATRIVLDVARTLGEVHAEGVFHRDLKETNILICGAAERPVLIDFGIATLVGASRLTGASLPPATEEYRAPEPLRFEREHPGGTTSYEFGPTDELWALGVTFYWLLTDEMPFGERTGDGGIKGLQERILTQRPLAPHVLNPRVPLAVSHLCMTLLAASPADRFPNVPDLCGALQEALAQAEGDPAWEVPLMDPHAPQVSTTDEDPAMLEPNEGLRAYRRRGNRRPRRGLLRPNEALSPVEAPEKEEPKQDEIPTVDAPSAAARSVGGGLSAAGTPVQVVPGRLGLPALVVNRSPSVAGRLGLVAALLALAIGVIHLSAGAWLGTSSRTGKGEAELTRPPTALGSGSTQADMHGHEVALTPKPLESLPGEGAEPVGALPPAPTVNAMPRTPAQTKKNEPQTKRAGLRFLVKPASMAAAAVAGCALMEGCTGSTPHVRPEIPAVTCPSGWKDTHDKYGIGDTLVVLQGYRGDNEERAPVREGPVSVYLPNARRLGRERMPEGTLLHGTWQLGENRFFGTFTQAQIPGRGTLPVCLVVAAQVDTGLPGKDPMEVFTCRPGLGMCPLPESKPGNIKTQPSLSLYPPGQGYFPVP